MPGDIGNSVIPPNSNEDGVSVSLVSDTAWLWQDALNVSAMLPESGQLEFQNLVPGQCKDRQNHMQLTRFSDDVTPNAASPIVLRAQ